MTKAHGKVTIEDVAREAGVSTMTVSRVVGGRGHVSDARRIAVESAVKRLGYIPSHVASALASGHTRTLSLVVPDVSNPFFAEIARGAEDEAYKAGYGLFLINTAESVDREEAATLVLLEQKVDGVIFCSPRQTDRTLKKTLNSLPPTIVLNRDSDAASGRSAFIKLDESGAAIMAVNHLLSRGSRNLAILAGPEESYSGKQRLSGFKKACKKNGLSISAAAIVHCQPTGEAAYNASLSLINTLPDLDGLVCFNNLVGAGALQACAELGKKVPEEIAIIAFDNTHMTQILNPKLSSLGLDLKKVGAQAVQSLIALIADPGLSLPSQIIQPQLHVRDSSKGSSDVS